MTNVTRRSLLAGASAVAAVAALPQCTMAPVPINLKVDVTLESAHYVLETLARIWGVYKPPGYTDDELRMLLLSKMVNVSATLPPPTVLVLRPWDYMAIFDADVDSIAEQKL
jgi:hypothetical protein